MVMADIQVKRWTLEEWDRLIDLGVFEEDERLELLDGEIVEMSPPGEEHVGATLLTAIILRKAFGERFTVLEEKPIRLDRMSKPQPDVAVFRGRPREYLANRDEEAILVVEVSQSSLAKDRKRKASLYARARRPEYWIVNVDDRALEVYREPVQDRKGHYDGWSYRQVRILGEDEAVEPLALPGVTIAVRELLP